MTKIQIGWKAKHKNNRWSIFRYEPIQLANIWIIPDGTGEDYLLSQHPEQPEIDWKDSLKPVYIEVEDD